MTDSEVIKIVRDHIERQFPMNCSMCEHRFLTLKDYLEYTTHLGQPVSYDAEKGDWQPLDPLGTLAYANCRCGTTLTISSHGMGLLTMWRLLRWARKESSRRKMSTGELLNDLRQNIDRQVLSENRGRQPMKAIRIYKFGPSDDVLQYEDVPVPEPKAGEVLIKVEAASLNRADIGLRKGTYRISPDALPVIPGRELAGMVVKLGANVSEFKTGQRVVAYPSLGGYAEYAVAKTTEIRPVPDAVTSAQAAALPTTSLTAWFGLLTDGNLKAGEWLLVQGGSSGVGVAAIQIAKHIGAKVITTSGSEEKCRRLRKLGAEVTIDVSENGFVPEVMRVTDNRGVDVVLEMIGGEVYQKSVQVLAPGGRLISIGGAFGPIPDPPPALTEGRKATRFSITNYLKAKPEDLNQLDTILKLVQEKKFDVCIDKSFPLAETRAAQRYLEGREHFGKVMLTM